MPTIPQIISAFQLILFQAFTEKRMASYALAIWCFTQKLSLRGPP